MRFGALTHFREYFGAMIWTTLFVGLAGCQRPTPPASTSPPAHSTTDSTSHPAGTAVPTPNPLGQKVDPPPADTTDKAADAADKAANATDKAADAADQAPAATDKAADAADKAPDAADKAPAAADKAPAATDKAADATDKAAAAVDSTADVGRQLYLRHCSACHGERGDGLGIAAAFVFPKPRDFRAGRFRLVSTANNVPTRDDLHQVLLRGMPGSSMPPWAHLSQQQRDALVSEVIRLQREGTRENYIALIKEQDELTDADIAKEEIQADIRGYVERSSTPGESTEVPPIPPPTAEALVRGKEVYAKNGCLQCHGAEGKGDGVQKMVDAENLPTAPRDFTLGIFKGGHDFASLYRRVAYGMPGTPMPGSRHLPPEQMADLVHYILSMSTEEQRQGAILKREKVVVSRVAELPQLKPTSEWPDIPATRLRSTPLWWRTTPDPELHVQAVHDGKSIAIRLSWKDENPDSRALQSEAFEDAIAVELFRGDAEPFLGMGSAEAPVEVWFWEADRESAADVEDQYPNVVVDVYPFSEQSAATSEFRRKGTARSDQPDVSLPALASGNQIVPGGPGKAGTDLAAGGPGTVTFRIPKSQAIEASGEWKAGRWTVVLTRPLQVASENDRIGLQPGVHASVAFALWDGSHQDRDGKKSITIWQDLELQE